MRSVQVITIGFLTVLLLANTACMQKNETSQDSKQRITTTNVPKEQIVILSQGNAKIVSNIPLKHNPSVKSGTIRYLRSGETVTIIGQTNPHWFKVADENKTVGYVPSDPKFIKINPKNLFIE